QNLLHRQTVQGASTITQQYVKNVYLNSEQTYARKIKEAMLAVKISHRYTKDQILEKYLNTVYFGHGAYGAQAAAETYFGVPASKLTILQGSMLAGLIRAPSSNDPYLNHDGALGRRNLVLDALATYGYLSAD